MKNSKNILITQNLVIGYSAKEEQKFIAQDINLNLKSGTLISLVGANGIGKSTLLRTLTGIHKPLSGTILLNEKPLLSYSRNELSQNLSVVLTEKLPPSNLTVFELVALGRQPYTNWIGTLTEEDLFQIKRAMQLTQIEQLADKKHFEISDGQLQKVLIARALAQNTPLIVLDEPTTHLDLVHKVTLFKLLKKLSQETDKCILFSTHDIDLVIQLSDEIIIMTPEILVQETPDEHILKGNFNRLFQDENIIFDKEKRKFLVKD